MFRKSAVTAALLLLTATSQLYALGLGGIDMQSALNQPMQAVIGLTSAAGEDIKDLKVSIASVQAHQRVGLSRTPVLNDFRFTIDSGPDGKPFIRVTSREAIREPFLEFLLEIVWSKGRLVREYTVLIDPPVTMPAATPAVPAAPVTQAPPPAPVVPAPVRQAAPPPPPAPPVAAPARTPPPAPPVAAPAPVAAPGQYGPVRRNETLWQIAKRLRPDRGISMEQMMLALQRQNPNAFVDNNINNLKAGATLTIPDRDEITSISRSQAAAENSRQFREWKEARSLARKAPVDEPAAETPVAEQTPATKSRLQLLAPEGETAEGMATSGTAQAAGEETRGIEDLKQQLTLATEDAEASRAQSDELQSRVTDLEQQIETMKRLLELKDDQLASMQNQQDTAAETTMEEVLELAAATTDEASAEEVALEMDTEDAAGEVIIAAADAAGEEVSEMSDAAAVEGLEETADAADAAGEPRSIVNKLMDNPVLAGLGVLVAMILGGFLWASTRQRKDQGLFDSEMTLEKHLEGSGRGLRQQQPVFADEEPAPEDTFDEAEEEFPPGGEENDPLTEADVYLAYGKTQQAAEVLRTALQDSPEDSRLKVKLLEVYYTSGDTASFDSLASDFRKAVTEDDDLWMKVAAMGYELSPNNGLYQAAAAGATHEAGADFDMDLSDLDTLSDQETRNDKPDSGSSEIGLDLDTAQPGGDDLSEGLEFTLDEAAREDDSEGVLNTVDEISTKLDLARAYLDMGDPEGARSILEEVMEEGNDSQRGEAESLISKLA